MLLVFLSISCSQWQCCQSFFGLAVPAETNCPGSGRAGRRFSWNLWWEGGGGWRYCPGAGGSAEGTDPASQLGQGNGVGSAPCSAGGGNSWVLVWVAFAMSVSLLHFWALVVQGNLCPPSTFSLFLVLFLFFWCYMRVFLCVCWHGVSRA